MEPAVPRSGLAAPPAGPGRIPRGEVWGRASGGSDGGLHCAWPWRLRTGASTWWEASALSSNGRSTSAGAPGKRVGRPQRVALLLLFVAGLGTGWLNQGGHVGRRASAVGTQNDVWLALPGGTSVVTPVTQTTTVPTTAPEPTPPRPTDHPSRSANAGPVQQDP